jgi:hypothetical protein
MASRTGYVGTQASGDILTAANYTKLPNGWIGWSQATADQTGIEAQVSLTNMGVTVTVGTSRRLKISVQVTVRADDGETLRGLLWEDGTQLDWWARETAGVYGPDGRIFSAFTIRAPTSGSHTYFCTLENEAGVAGTPLSTSASSTHPGWILVEDIGPAS